MQIDVDFIHNQRNTNICMALSVCFGLSQYTCALQTPRRIWLSKTNWSLKVKKKVCCHAASGSMSSSAANKFSSQKRLLQPLPLRVTCSKKVTESPIVYRCNQTGCRLNTLKTYLLLVFCGSKYWKHAASFFFFFLELFLLSWPQSFTFLYTSPPALYISTSTSLLFANI